MARDGTGRRRWTPASSASRSPPPRRQRARLVAARARSVRVHGERHVDSSPSCSCRSSWPPCGTCSPAMAGSCRSASRRSSASAPTRRSCSPNAACNAYLGLRARGARRRRALAADLAARVPAARRRIRDRHVGGGRGAALLVTNDSSVGGGTGRSLTALIVYDPATDRRTRTGWRSVRGRPARAGFVLLRSRFGSSLQPLRDDERGGLLARHAGRRARSGSLFLLAAFGCGAAARLVCHHAAVQPDSIFGLQWTAYMIFMVLLGGLGTFEGPILGALVLFGAPAAVPGPGRLVPGRARAGGDGRDAPAPRGCGGRSSTGWASACCRSAITCGDGADLDRLNSCSLSRPSAARSSAAAARARSTRSGSWGRLPA